MAATGRSLNRVGDADFRGWTPAKDVWWLGSEPFDGACRYEATGIVQPEKLIMGLITLSAKGDTDP